MMTPATRAGMEVANDLGKALIRDLAAPTTTPTLKRYRITTTYTVTCGVIATSGPDAIEKWRAQGPYVNGGPTREAQALLHLLDPKNKARMTPEVRRMREM